MAENTCRKRGIIAAVRFGRAQSCRSWANWNMGSASGAHLRRPLLCCLQCWAGAEVVVGMGATRFPCQLLLWFYIYVRAWTNYGYIYIYIYIYICGPKKIELRINHVYGNTKHGVATSALCGCGSGAPRGRAKTSLLLRRCAPCVRTSPPGGKRGKTGQVVATSALWIMHGGSTGRRLIGCFLQQGGEVTQHPEELHSAVWRMEQGGRSLATCLCFVARKSPRFLHDGPYRLARGILSVVRTSVVHRAAGPGPIGTWGPPLAPAFVLLAVLGGGRGGGGHGRKALPMPAAALVLCICTRMD